MRLIRDGEKEGGEVVWRWWGREIIYLSQHCHHQYDSSSDSHFNVSLIVREKFKRQCPQTTTFEEKYLYLADSNQGPTAYRPNTLPLGHTDSQTMYLWWSLCTLYLHACLVSASYWRQLRSFFFFFFLFFSFSFCHVLFHKKSL